MHFLQHFVASLTSFSSLQQGYAIKVIKKKTVNCHTLNIFAVKPECCCVNSPRSESTIKGLKPAFKPAEMTHKRFRRTFSPVVFVIKLPAQWKLGAEWVSSPFWASNRIMSRFECQKHKFENLLVWAFTGSIGCSPKLNQTDVRTRWRVLSQDQNHPGQLGGFVFPVNLKDSSAWPILVPE